MALRFWRRIKIAPGLTLNLSKSGGSLSIGPRGAKITVGPRGRRATVGIPGTGLFYTTTSKTGRSRNTRRGAAGSRGNAPADVTDATDSAAQRPENRLTLGFFKRLITPKDEEALVDGCRELFLGHERKALDHLRRAAHLADGAFLAGFLSLKLGRDEDAAGYLEIAAAQRQRLGRHFSKYGVTPTMSLPVTDEIAAHAEPNLRGVLLGLVEAYQRLQRWHDAIACLERLLRLEPDDVVVKLSLAELLLDARPGDRRACRKIVRLASGLENDSPIHAALLLYRARALRGLGLLDAARETLTAGLRRWKHRPPELLRAMRYERALICEDLGQRGRARRDFEKLYAEAPDYEDVAQRLGLR